VEPRARRLLATWIGAAGCAPSVVIAVYTLAGPAILATFDLTYDRMGLLMSAGMVGYGVSALVGGVLLDLIAVRTLARGALVLAAAACVGGSLAPVWGLLGAATVILGAAGGLLTVLPIVLFADLYPEDRTRTMTRWQLVLSLATVALPLVLGVLLAKAAGRFGDDRGWRVLIMGCAPLFVGLLLLVPGSALGRRAAGASPRLGDLAEVARRPMVLSVIVIGALHVAADTAAYSWIVLMAKERFGSGPGTAGVLIAGYALAYALGRLVRGAVRWPWRPLPTVAVGSLVGSVVLVLAVRAPSLPAVIGTYAAAGVFLSLNWPSLLGYAGERFADRAGTVIGAINAATAPSTVLVSVLVGVVSRLAGAVSVGMLVPAALFLTLSLVAAAADLRSRRLD